MKFLRQLFHRMVRLSNGDDTFEEVAKQHRLNREIANQCRRNRQQDQGQRNNPRCLDRLLAWRQAMMLVMAVIIVMRAMVGGMGAGVRIM